MPHRLRNVTFLFLSPITRQSSVGESAIDRTRLVFSIVVPICWLVEVSQNDSEPYATMAANFWLRDRTTKVYFVPPGVDHVVSRDPEDALNRLT